MFVLQITPQIHFESKHQNCHCQCMTNAYPHNNNNNKKKKRDSSLKISNEWSLYHLFSNSKRHMTCTCLICHFAFSTLH